MSGILLKVFLPDFPFRLESVSMFMYLADHGEYEKEADRASRCGLFLRFRGTGAVSVFARPAGGGAGQSGGVRHRQEL